MKRTSKSKELSEREQGIATAALLIGVGVGIGVAAKEGGDVQLPSRAEVLKLIKPRDAVCRVFVVGSFARGEASPDSDLDVLLEVAARPKKSAVQLEAEYRRKVGHKRWCGRLVDVYVTYDADSYDGPMVELV